jgi:hypothetical protein
MFSQSVRFETGQMTFFFTSDTLTLQTTMVTVCTTCFNTKTHNVCLRDRTIHTMNCDYFPQQLSPVCFCNEDPVYLVLQEGKVVPVYK